MDSLAGVVVLAVVGLWLAYLVPHRLRQRQQMLESRVDDRFSGNLRVLAVATAGGVAPSSTARKTGRRAAAAALHSHGDCTTSSSMNAPLLTPPHGMSVRHRRHHLEGEQDMEHTPSPASATAPARAGLHARRAAAARRRALLTVTLLVLTAATGALAATTAVSGWFVLAPAALLAAVLVLGRRSVQANARADAAWETRERDRQAARSAARLAGRPAPAVRPQVTGHAVKSSQSHTQMIARVHPDGSRTVPAGDGPVAARPAAGVVDEASAESGAPLAEADEVAGEVSVTAVGGLVAAGAPVDGGAPGADASADTAAGGEWVSVPVPRPVYTMKSAAPRWDPAPLTAEMAQITLARRAELAAGDSAPGATDEPATSDMVAAEAPSDSLGVDLDSVLARRRAAGE